MALKAVEEREDSITSWKTYKIPHAYVKSYKYNIMVLGNLKLSERHVLDFILEEMNDDNLVTNDLLFKKKFNETMAVFNIRYTNNTINKAFVVLVKENLLLKTDMRGVYKINPINFYKNSQAERRIAIRNDLEKPVRNHIEKNE